MQIVRMFFGVEVGVEDGCEVGVIISDGCVVVGRFWVVARF